VRTTSAADVNAEVVRQLSEIMRVATTSSNLKGTYVKILRDAASYIAAWVSDPRWTDVTQGSNTGAARLAEARIPVLEEENAALRNQLARRATCVHECPRCGGTTSESGRPLRESGSESARLAAL
jgi:hypothetical protein